MFRNLLPDGSYIFAGTSTSGLRFFSSLNDRIYEPQIDYSIPFFKGSITGLFKIGFRATARGRDFGARRFLFNLQRSNTVDLFLPSNELFAPENIRPDAFQLIEYTRSTDTYTASMNIYAGYAMVDLGLGARWRLVGGLRIEDAEQIVTTVDNLSAAAKPVEARLHNTDPAPGHQRHLCGQRRTRTCAFPTAGRCRGPISGSCRPSTSPILWAASSRPETRS